MGQFGQDSFGSGYGPGVKEEQEKPETLQISGLQPRYTKMSYGSYKTNKLRSFESASELYRLSDRQWSANFGAKFCG
jgi:hypothetical protein